MPDGSPTLMNANGFVNDRWNLNQYLNFNLGARYEKTKSHTNGGIEGIDTSNFVPRLEQCPKGERRSAASARAQCFGQCSARSRAASS